MKLRNSMKGADTLLFDELVKRYVMNVSPMLTKKIQQKL